LKELAVNQIKLLIIDDDVDQRDLTREVLEDRFGSECAIGVGSGAEAVTQPLSDFDLILCDWNLPDTNGLELLEKIRQRCETPVIMVTGENVSEFAAEAIRRGATDYVVKVENYFFTIPLVVEKNLTTAKLARENSMLRRDLEISLASVKESNQQLQNALYQVEQMAATDALTGLFNRRHFNVVIEQLFAESQRYETDLACVLIDLDEYKQLNDNYGHQTGDQVLVAVGEILRRIARKSDVAARYGGDEFVLLLPRSDSQEASKLMTRIRDDYRRQTADMLKSARGMTMSVGIASIVTNQPANAAEFLAAADEALYQSKNSGRDRMTLSGVHKARLAG